MKVPVTAEGLAAIKMLKAEGIPTLGTAVYGAAQGMLSALAGQSMSRLTLTAWMRRAETDPDRCGITAIAGAACPQSKVLAASFKTRVRRWIACWRL